MYLEGQQNSVQRLNYYALLRSKVVVYFLHFLADVTAALSDVSTAFQQKEITIADINSEITACKEVIEKYGKMDGPSLKMINGKDQFLGETTGAPSSAFEEATRGMVQGLLTSLSGRFEGGGGKRNHCCVINRQPEAVANIPCSRKRLW